MKANLLQGMLCSDGARLACLWIGLMAGGVGLLLWIIAPNLGYGAAPLTARIGAASWLALHILLVHISKTFQDPPETTA